MSDNLDTSRYTITDNTTAQRVTSAIEGSDSVIIKALSTNTGDIEIGKAGFGVGTGFPLAKGEWVEIPIQNPSRIFARAATANDKVAIIAVRP